MPPFFTRDQIVEVLQAPQAEWLKIEADKVRTQAKGDGVFLRGIIEFSSYCIRNCLYCGLRAANGQAVRFRLSPEAIKQQALAIAAAGIGTVVLQSGDDLAYPAEDIADIVHAIKRQTGIAVVLSLGEREDWEYALWRSAGADRYLIKHETANADLYAALHPGKTLKQRRDAQHLLQSLGFELGTGFIVGLPGQTDAILADDVLLVREMGADMCGLGPFVPQAQTPLANHPSGNVETTLRLIALLRLMCPEINLPATTALATLDPENGQCQALLAGANVIMPNFTPQEERGKYTIYDNKLSVDLKSAIDAVKQTGRHVVWDGGLKEDD